ncbi:MAG: PD-(D/E)XK nuclease family protein [Actinobacteria bacterium]|nr:PD-(D/E)XK nuclease family protein [Actinomycetota bacterium]
MAGGPVGDLAGEPAGDPAVERAAEPVGGAPVRAPGLSPSRAKDFQQCPLLFRFRVVDRLPEPSSQPAARGTLVHAVLEALFDSPAPERTVEQALRLLDPHWQRLLERDPALAELFGSPEELTAWLDSARVLIGRYFEIEDPTRLAPRARELRVDHQLESGPALRGIIDRVDVAPNGWVRIVDYKTGRSPRPGYEADALFQMRFYAFVVWRTRGVLPRTLQLEYLGDGTLVTHEPTEAEMVTFETRIRALWTTILEVAASGRWTPRPSPLCSWCSFRDLCPQFGGTPPPIDEAALQRAFGPAA